MEKKYSKHVIIENLEENHMMVSSSQDRSLESKAVDHMFDIITSDYYKPSKCYL